MSLVRIGDAVGLYKILHARGPMTVAELAAETGVNQRYLCEWLSHQAASNYLAYDPATQSFTLPPEQAMVFAIDDSPVSMLGAFDVMAAMLENGEKVQPAFRTGGGVRWSDQASCLFCATARFSVRAITITSSATDSRRSTVSSKNCNAAPRWPMSGAVTADPPC
jgi:hypothetical protein